MSGKRARTAGGRRWPFYLVAGLILAELASFGIGGTFASYTSQVNNPASSLGTGTLTLSTTSGTATCSSYTAPDNADSSCGSMTLSPAGPFFPGQTSTVSVTVENTGSLPGALSAFSLLGCSSLTLCGEVELYVEETNAAGTPIACYYPSAGTSCSFSSTGTMNDFANNTYYDSFDALSFGSVGAVTKRYFVFGFYLPTFSSPAVGNQYQGLSAEMDLSWYLSQQ